jgi:hypothetical protein
MSGGVAVRETAFVRRIYAAPVAFELHFRDAVKRQPVFLNGALALDLGVGRRNNSAQTDE